MGRDALAKRIERYLKTWSSRLGYGEDVDRFCSDLSSGRVRLPEETLSRPEEASTECTITTMRGFRGTESLVLEVLLHYSKAPLSPSEILWEIKDGKPILGYMLNPRAIYSALRRLTDRGMVIRVGRGRYLVNPMLMREEPFYVENLVVSGKPVWSKREKGYPIPLSEGLSLAEDLGLGNLPISEMELGIALKDSETTHLLQLLRRRGVKGVKIYLNVEEGVKVEALLGRPPLTASLENYFNFVALYTASLRASLEALLKSLIISELYLRDHGLKLDETAWASWRRRMCSLLRLVCRLYGCSL